MSVLDRLEALLAQATPGGPWTASIYGAGVHLFRGRPVPTNADASLIAEAVNALPALIACARALQAWESWTTGMSPERTLLEVREQIDQALARLVAARTRRRTVSEQYQEIDPYRVVPSDPDCPLCGHAWSRHDPDDGLCDAPAYAALGACPCGRNRLWMAGRIAHLSRLFLSPKERKEPA